MVELTRKVVLVKDALLYEVRYDGVEHLRIGTNVAIVKLSSRSIVISYPVLMHPLILAVCYA
jgi:hypothetical protein